MERAKVERGSWMMSSRTKIERQEQESGNVKRDSVRGSGWLEQHTCWCPTPLIQHNTPFNNGWDNSIESSLINGVTTPQPRNADDQAIISPDLCFVFTQLNWYLQLQTIKTISCVNWNTINERNFFHWMCCCPATIIITLSWVTTYLWLNQPIYYCQSVLCLVTSL